MVRSKLRYALEILALIGLTLGCSKQASTRLWQRGNDRAAGHCWSSCQVAWNISPVTNALRRTDRLQHLAEFCFDDDRSENRHVYQFLVGR